MKNITAEPKCSGKPYRLAANPNRKISIAAVSILFASLSSHALAAPACSAYIPHN